MRRVLTLALAPLAAALSLLSAYLVGLTLLALVADRQGPPDGPRRRRFAVLVPAHDEEALIARLLASLERQDYARERFDVHVVADNCHDQTASRARAGGAIVHERFDEALRGKGFALRWLLERLASQGQAYDAYVVLDADSVVAEGFLRRMDARLEAGSKAIQAYYSVLNAGDSPVAALRYAALAAVHYARPLGRSVFGGSAGLKGNGMCFAAPILARFSWDWFTLAEDVEFHLALVKAGLRVDFAPEASVWADMPVTLAQAESQNARWERGRLQLLRTHVPGLLREGLRRRSLLQLDAAAEQCVPPLSVPVALGGLCVVAGLATGQRGLAALAGVSLAGQVAHLLGSLALVRAPRRAYVALAYAPLYVAWKVALYARALLPTPSTGWVRTARVTPDAG